MPAVAIPAILGAASVGTGIYSAHKLGQATDAQANIAQGQLGLAQRQEGRANQLFQLGAPGLQDASSYYRTLLRGNRSQMALATAGPRAAITDQYRGAEQGLEQSGVRGAVRDLAKAELSRGRAGDVARLTTGVQPMAAAALGDLGTTLAGQGQSGLSAAQGGLSGAAGTYANVFTGRLAQDQVLTNTFRDLGGSFFDILNGIQNRGGSLNGPKPTPLMPSQLPGYQSSYPMTSGF